MNPNQRFSILTFPQFFDGAELAVSIVVLPRDQNPLSDAIVQHPTAANTLFVGTVAGGVWRTDNADAASPHWVTHTDGLPSLSRNSPPGTARWNTPSGRPSTVQPKTSP